MVCGVGVADIWKEKAHNHEEVHSIHLEGHFKVVKYIHAMYVNEGLSQFPSTTSLARYSTKISPNVSRNGDARKMWH